MLKYTIKIIWDVLNLLGITVCLLLWNTGIEAETFLLICWILSISLAMRFQMYSESWVYSMLRIVVPIIAYIELSLIENSIGNSSFSDDVALFIIKLAILVPYIIGSILGGACTGIYWIVKRCIQIKHKNNKSEE